MGVGVLGDGCCVVGSGVAGLNRLAALGDDTIKHWAEASFDELADPQDFAAALEDTEWKGPDAFVFRGDEDDEEFKTHIAVDLFPNNPNVAYESVFFNSEVFADDALWDIEQVGPYVVISRTK